MAVFDTDTESLKQYNRLRRAVAASEDVLSNSVAEEYFEEAQELYPDDTAKMIAYSRVVALEGIRASSAMLGKYAQNQSEEDLTKVFDNLSDMLKEAREAVEKAADPVVLAEVTPFFFTKVRGRRGQ
jgi:hypothetical protein